MIRRNTLPIRLALIITLLFSYSTLVQADTIYWEETGSGMGPWDTTTPNWNGDDTTYSDGDDVRFHSSIGDQGTVVIQGAGVSPNSILFQSGGAGSWTFTGGDITGATGVSSTASGAQPTWSRNGSYSFTGGLAAFGTHTFAPQLTSSGTYHFGSDGSSGGGDITFTGGSFNFNPSMTATLDNNFILSSSNGNLSGNSNASFSSNVAMGANLSLSGTADYSGLSLALNADRTLNLPAISASSASTVFNGDIISSSGSTLRILTSGAGSNAVSAISGTGGWDIGNVEINGARRVKFQGDGDTFFDQLNANGGKVRLTGGARWVKDVTSGGVTNGTLNVGYSLEVTSGTTVEGDITNINSDGVLSGTGNILTLLNVNNGGVLSPGSSPGTLTLEDDLTMNSGSSLRIEADSAVSHDIVNLINASTVTLNNPTLDLAFTFDPLFTDRLFIVTSADDSTPVSGTFAGLTEGSQITFGGMLATISYLGEVDSLSLSGGNDIVLFDFQAAPVPEPSTLMLLGLGLVPWLRKKRQQARCQE